jgi:N6-adenosine-specific RNA methylase IME4
MRKNPIDDGPFKGLQRNYYQAMMVDIPWHFKRYAEVPLDTPGCRATEVHYPTLNLNVVKAMPVVSLAAAHCWLFMWVIASHLPHALAVMAAWGFTYSSDAFNWIKVKQCHDGSLMLSDSDLRTGKGFTTRKGSELCLLGRRGKALTADAR